MSIIFMAGDHYPNALRRLITLLKTDQGLARYSYLDQMRIMRKLEPRTLELSDEIRALQKSVLDLKIAAYKKANNNMKKKQLLYGLIRMPLPERVKILQEAMKEEFLPVSEIMAPLGAESAAAFEELTLSGRDDLLRRQIKNAWPNSFRESRFYSAVDYVQADRLRRDVMQKTHEFFSQVDVVFGPSFGTPMLSLTNFTGQPCLVMRAGFEEITPRPLFGHPENDTDETLHRIPRSVCLWSNLFEEGKIIRVGRALEAALGVAGERPPLG